MRKDHEDQVNRWASFVKNNPRRVWIKDLKNLVDSQINKANSFYDKLSKTPEGREKLKKLKGMH